MMSILSRLAASRYLSTKCVMGQGRVQLMGRARALHTVTLGHHDDEGWASQWHNDIDNETVKADARRVVIHTAPYDLWEGRDYDIWNDWEARGRYPAFTGAIDRIRELRCLTSVNIVFSDECMGVTSNRDPHEKESSRTRINALKSVFQAIQQRAEENPSFPSIGSLTIKNLQNMPIPEFTDSSLFKTVMKDITELHLHVAVESSWHGPDYDLYQPERVTFEPYLQKYWLEPFAHQLTALSLSFNECWGTMPGYFDGRGLIFPRLKALTLGNFVASHHGHFNWVLNQPSLTSLHLHNCFIASYLSLLDEDLERWRIPLQDCEKLPTGSFGFNYKKDNVFKFPGTWETVFDKMRLSLSNLEDFRFGYERSFEPDDGENDHDGLEKVRSWLHNTRYITLDTGLLPSPWIDAAEHDGEMQFGTSFRQPGGLNIAKQHEAGDKRAFKELQQTISKRKVSFTAKTEG